MEKNISTHKILRPFVIAVGLIVLVTFVVFFPSLGNQFVDWDDGEMIYDNPKITSLSWDNISTMFTSSHYGMYHPLVLVSYAVEYKYFGLNPRIYHTTNLALHILNSVMVFFFIYLLSRNLTVSLIVGILFGIHPIQVESVAWATERKDVLYSLFFLGSLIAYLKYIVGKKKAYYFLALFLFFFSLLSKPMAISLPFLLILCDYLLNRKINKKTILEKIPFLLFSVLFGIIAIFAKQATGGLVVPEPPLSYKNIFISSYRILFYYLPRLSFLFNFTRLYPHNSYVPPEVVKLPSIFWFSPFILAAIFIAFIYFFRKNKKVIFGIVFFLISIAPVALSFAIGLFADRYSYIPSVGIFYLLGLAIYWTYQKISLPKKIATNVIAIILIITTGIIGVYTWQRCGIWKDSITLYNEVCKWYPNIPAPFQHRGELYAKKGEDRRAIEDFNKALEIDPEFVPALVSRGNAFVRIGAIKLAMKDYSRALEINPDEANAHNNIGYLLFIMGEVDKGISEINRSIELNPSNSYAYYNRGKIYLSLKKYKLAIKDFDKALQINPRFASAYVERHIAYFKLGKYSQALKDSQKAISLGISFPPEDIELLLKKMREEQENH